MFEEMNETLPDIQKCLERIGMDGIEIRHDIETLDRLVHGFTTHIPYENLQISVEHKMNSMAVRDLYDKMIVRKRGGYCFEMNGLFWLMLRDLGFDAYSVSAFIMIDNDHKTDLGHRAVVVSIDGKKYVCDVGSGGNVTADFAIPMDGSVKNSFFVMYDEERKEYTLCQEEVEGFKKLIMYRDFYAYPQEFNLPNIAVFYIKDNPQVHSPLCSIKNERGEVYTIKNGEFRAKTANGSFSRKIRDQAELLELAEKYFGIKIRPENAG